MTLKELEPIVADYHRALPNWHVLEKELIARESGPILQYIGFERLSTGAYRVQYGIYYLCVADRDGGFVPNYLSVKQSIHARAHNSMRDKVVEAIHKEIVPSVDALLDPEQVLSLHEAHEPIRSPDAHHLAALNACLGHDDRALYWCCRFPELVEETGLGWHEWDYKRQAFLESLKQWIEAGEAKEQLEPIVQDERRKWGLI
jgi:hypothetical protein